MSVVMELTKTMMMTIGLHYIRTRGSVIPLTTWNVGLSMSTSNSWAANVVSNPILRRL